MQSAGTSPDKTGRRPLPIYTRATIAGLVWIGLLFPLLDTLASMEPGGGLMEGLIAGLFFGAPALVLAALLTRYRTWPSLIAAVWMLFVFVAHVQFVFQPEPGTTTTATAASSTGAIEATAMIRLAMILFLVVVALIGTAAFISFRQHRHGAPRMTSTRRERLTFVTVSVAALAVPVLVLASR